MTWKEDPGLNPERLAEDAARRADAFEAAKAAALAGDWEPARELAALAREDADAGDAGDLAHRIGEASDVAALAALAPKAAPRLATVTDWTGDPRPRAWLAPAWLPCGRAALFTGPGGGGKSLFALQLAAGIAGGDRNPFRSDPRGGADHAPRLDGEPGPALVCTWEDEPEEVRRRLAWAGVDRAALGDRLHVADLAGRGPLWGPVDGAHRDTVATLTEAGAAVEALIRELRPRLAVIDPTAGAFAASENDRAAVRGWLSPLGALAADTGAAVLLVAHPPKDAGHAFSGSTDWRGGVRSLWTLRPEAVPGWTGAPNGRGEPKAPAQGRALTLDKANYARDGRRAWLRLQVIDGPAPGDPPALMRWEESTAREAAEAYHDWRGWEAPERKGSDTSGSANGRAAGPARRGQVA